jgi:PAS domain S-box-containing protein
MAFPSLVGAEDRQATESRRSIKRVIVFGLILICGALVALESWTSWRSLQAATSGTKEDAETLALSLTEHATSAIASTDNLLRQSVELLEHDGLSAATAPRLDTLLAERSPELTQVDFFAVVDADGVWRAASTPTLSTAAIADRDYFIYHRDHRDRGLRFSGLIRSRFRGSTVIVASRRFDKADGSFGGIVMAALRPAFFQAFIDALMIGHEGVTSMLLDDGTLLVRRPVAADQIGRNFSFAPLFTQHLPNAAAGSFQSTSPLDGIERQAAYRRVPGTPLVAVAALSISEELADWSRQAATHAGAVAAIILVLGGLGFFLIRQIARIERAERTAAAAAAEAGSMGAQYRLLADNARDMITRVGMDGVHRYVSPASRDLLDYAPGELVGMAAFRQIHPEDRPRWREHIAAAAAGSAAPYCSYRLRHRDGHYLWVEATTHVVFETGPDGAAVPLEYVEVVRDITLRREAELRLLDAIESLDDGFSLWSADRRLVLCNTRYREIYAAIADLLVPGGAMRALIVEGARRGQYGDVGDPESFADRPAEDDPAERLIGGRWILRRERPMASGGWVGVDADVTERRQRESDLAEARTRQEHQAAELVALAGDLSVAKDEAERANRVKSEFLATMSHEIRTPMNGIIGMNALLSTSELTPAQHRFSDAIRISAESLMAIINDILDVSKLEAGKVELEAIDFNLVTLIEDAVELMAPRAREKHLEIAADLSPLAATPMCGDPARLRQILLNLLSNAVKFTERGYVSVDTIVKEAADGQLRIAIAVADTGIGIGIGEADRARLFERFAQADGSITRRYGGTGLGLNISKQLIELMGGTIAMMERPGGGSVFRIDVALPKGAGKAAPPPAVLAGRQALIVDDLPINRTILRRLLTGFGAACAESPHGDAALAALDDAARAGRPFDLVVLDQMMPGMSGDALASAIRARTAMPQPKLVLVSSAGTLPGDAAARSGIDRVLLKPVRQSELGDCVIRLFGSVAEFGPSHRPPAVPAPADGVSGHVLVVEDNAINREVARAVLERLGCTVDMAEDGMAALAVIEDGGYQLVLMDVQMPRLDGLEATRRIRALGRRFAHIPIVAMTANAMHGDAARCLECGMNDYIAKPIDPAEVGAKLAHWLATQQATA